MFNKIASQIADQLEASGIIKSEDKSLYTYGLQQGLIILLNITTTIILGCIFGKVVQAIMFTVLYMPLRRFAGGYHAKTPMRCYIYSTLLVAVILILSQYLEQHFWMLIILSVLSAVAIALFSPVEDQHKPLDDTEQWMYRKKAIWILGIELFVTLVAALLYLNSLLVSLTLNLLTVGLLQVIGCVKNAINKNRNKKKMQILHGRNSHKNRLK